MTNNAGNKDIRKIELKKKTSLGREELKINQLDSNAHLRAERIFSLSSKVLLKN